jgi:hypothetical protein
MVPRSRGTRFFAGRNAASFGFARVENIFRVYSISYKCSSAADRKIPLENNAVIRMGVKAKVSVGRWFIKTLNLSERSRPRQAVYNLGTHFRISGFYDFPLGSLGTRW